MEELSSRERMLLTISGRPADRVPVCPDISNMVPCRLTGKPFYDIYLYNDPPLWKAYLHALDYFKFDGWFNYLSIDFTASRQFTVKSAEEKQNDRIVRRSVISTPAGELTEKHTFYFADSPTPTEKLIKDFKHDFPKFKYLFPKITGYDDGLCREQIRLLGERGFSEITLGAPGFHIFSDYFEGNLEACVYAYYDYPELFEELYELYVNDLRQKLDIILEIKPDSVLTGGSGSITMQSEALFDKFSLPVIKEVSAKCRQAGVLCGVHSCGKEKHLIKRCCEQTDLDYVNPLEIAPMGDCDLAEIKRLYGGKITLMGNLHTTNVMLKGSSADVERESLKAIKAAGAGGRFILSTGDQCGRDTPDANIFAMVRAAKEFGAYPLDIKRIDQRLQELL